MDICTAYRESEARSSNPIRLVVLLYEQLLQDLRRALEACDRNDIVGRTHELDHALAVAGHLQATLDLEHGGEVAQNLDQFYGLLRSALLAAQVNASRQLLEQQIANVLSLHEAWRVVERGNVRQVPQPTAAFQAASSPADAESGSSRSAADWRA